MGKIREVCANSNLGIDVYRTRYPTALKQHIHVTKADLPLDVARALSSDPSLVQKAVETFYTRDALQLRVGASETSC